MKYFSLFALIAALLTPDLVLAQAGGFVPCSGTDCSLCSFAQMGNTILQWLIGLLFVVFAVMVAVAGFGLVTSGGNPSAKQAAKDKLVNALVGIIIVLAAWLLVDTLIRGLVGTSGQVNGTLWHTVSCQSQRVPVPGTGFPPSTQAFSYQIYEEDTANNCLIPHPGGGSNQSICGSNQTATMNSISGTMYVIQSCLSGVPTVSQPASPQVCGASGPQCNNDSALMALYNGSPRSTNAPVLNTMVQCYQNNLSLPTGVALDTSQIYTFEISEPRCGPTNGTAVAACGITCAHSVNSCHYGRGGGQGAMAVDFNAVPGTQAAEQALFNALQALQGTCGGTLLFEPTSATSWHTHISAPGC